MFMSKIANIGTVTIEFERFLLSPNGWALTASTWDFLQSFGKGVEWGFQICWVPSGATSRLVLCWSWEFTFCMVWALVVLLIWHTSQFFSASISFLIAFWIRTGSTSIFNLTSSRICTHPGLEMVSQWLRIFFATIAWYCYQERGIVDTCNAPDKNEPDWDLGYVPNRWSSRLNWLCKYLLLFLILWYVRGLHFLIKICKLMACRLWFTPFLYLDRVWSQGGSSESGGSDSSSWATSVGGEDAGDICTYLW